MAAQEIVDILDRMPKLGHQVTRVVRYDDAKPNPDGSLPVTAGFFEVVGFATHDLVFRADKTGGQLVDTKRGISRYDMDVTGLRVAPVASRRRSGVTVASLPENPRCAVVTPRAPHSDTPARGR